MGRPFSSIPRIEACRALFRINIGDKAYDSDPLDEKLAVVLSHPSGARMGRPFSCGLKLAELCSGSTHPVQANSVI
jgi:hypothetical protein